MNKRDGDVAPFADAPADDKDEDDDEASAFAMLESHGGMQFLSAAAVDGSPFRGGVRFRRRRDLALATSAPHVGNAPA